MNVFIWTHDCGQSISCARCRSHNKPFSLPLYLVPAIRKVGIYYLAECGIILPTNAFTWDHIHYLEVSYQYPVKGTI